MRYKSITINGDGSSSTDQYADETAAMTAYGASLNNPAIVLFWIYDGLTETWFIGGPQ